MYSIPLLSQCVYSFFSDQISMYNYMSSHLFGNSGLYTEYDVSVCNYLERVVKRLIVTLVSTFRFLNVH